MAALDSIYKGGVYIIYNRRNRKESYRVRRSVLGRTSAEEWLQDGL